MVAYFPDINLALDYVVDRLKGVGIEAAVNTAEVNPPGAWVKFVGFSNGVLSGDELVDVEVSVVVGAMPLRDAYAALSDLAAEVVEECGHPDGPVRQQATTFGNDVVALPTLVLPYHVNVSKEGTPVP